METENRTLLIFFSVVVLLIFLDHQSDRQLKLAGLERVESLKAKSITSAVLDETVELDRLYRPALERTAKKKITQAVEDASELIEDETVTETARQQAGEIAEGLSENATRVVKKSLTTLNKAKLQLKEVALDETHAATDELPFLPSIKKDGHLQTQLSLYYPGFQGRKTVMMKVQRIVPERIDARKALMILQKGPSAKEKGLVNAFDTSIEVKDLRMNGEIVEVTLSESVHRMSAPVRKDRLDQLCLTLLQFPEIRGVRILVSGHVISKLGTGEDAIPIVQPVRHIDRQIEDYRPL